MKFGDDFHGCRQHFLQSAQAAGRQVHSTPHPELAEAGVAVDAVQLGNGPHLRVLISGAHGVELPFGSAVQCAVLDGDVAVPDEVTLLLVHAINCFGAYRQRRFTDGNIDLCRNFSEPPYPANPLHERLAPWLNAAPEAAEEADRALAALAEEMGRDYIAGVMGGQFDDPQGFSYGGTAPCWSRSVLESLLQPFVGNATDLVVLDLHTGVGPFAVPSFVCLQDDPGVARASARFGAEITTPRARRADGGTLHPAVGHPTEGYERKFAGIPVTSVVLEMGTLPPTETLPVMLQEHRFERHGQAQSEAARALRQQMWDQHAPADATWRAQALQAGLKAVEALVSEDRGTP